MDNDDSSQKTDIPDWIAKSGWLKAEEEPDFSNSTEKSEVQEPVTSSIIKPSQNVELSEAGELDQADANTSDPVPSPDLDRNGEPSDQVGEIFDNEELLPNPLDTSFPADQNTEDEVIPELPDWLKNYEPGLRDVENIITVEAPITHVDDKVDDSVVIPPILVSNETPPALPEDETVTDDSLENEKDATVAIEEVEDFVPEPELLVSGSDRESDTPNIESVSQGNEIEEIVTEIPQVEEVLELIPPTITVDNIIENLHKGDFARLTNLAREYELTDQPIDELISKVKELSGDMGDRAEYWHFLGDLLDHNSQFEEAIDALKKAETILLT